MGYSRARMELPPPRSPMDRWPVQVADPRFGYAWYCGEGVVVSQAVLTHGTEEAAHAYHDVVDAALAAAPAEFEAAGGLYVIHDFRLVRKYDAGARTAWQERMRRRGRGYLRGSTVVVHQASPLLKMAVQAINLMASLSLGSRIELASDPSVVLAELGVTGPAPRFPGRT